MDYKQLLKKYIEHVAYHEGISYIGKGCESEDIFTQEEWDHLIELDKQSQSESEMVYIKVKMGLMK